MAFPQTRFRQEGTRQLLLVGRLWSAAPLVNEIIQLRPFPPKPIREQGLGMESPRKVVLAGSYCGFLPCAPSLTRCVSKSKPLREKHTFAKTLNFSVLNDSYWSRYTGSQSRSARREYKSRLPKSRSHLTKI